MLLYNEVAVSNLKAVPYVSHSMYALWKGYSFHGKVPTSSEAIPKSVQRLLQAVKDAKSLGRSNAQGKKVPAEFPPSDGKLSV